MNPSSGTTVVAGQDLDYTLSFRNDGEAAGPVDYTDLMGGILDDADVVGVPSAIDSRR